MEGDTRHEQPRQCVDDEGIMKGEGGGGCRGQALPRSLDAANAMDAAPVLMALRRVSSRVGAAVAGLAGRSIEA